MEILCSLSNINLSFGTKEIFTDASLTIHKNDRIGLLGLNGNGKSSLFKIITGELRPDICEPKFNFSKATGKGDDSKKFSVFSIPQELPLEKDDTVTVKDYIFRFYPQMAKVNDRLNVINTTLENTNSNIDLDILVDEQKALLEGFEHMGAWDLINSYQSYLKYFGHEDLSKKVIDLSGGEQKKILLSLGLSARENVILWDEPTNHLDIETIKLFEDELESQNKTYILVTHDRYLLGKLTNKIYHIQFGKIERFEGSYPQYLEHLAEKEEERVKVLTRLKNTLRRETEWMRQGIKARGCRSKKRVENFHDLSNSITALKLKAKKELEMSIVSSGRKTRSLVEYHNASFSYDDKEIFSDLNITISKGNKIGLVGPNGAGKTTLVNMITGAIEKTSGSEKRADSLVIQHFSQKRDELDDSKTPFELLGEGEDNVHLPDGRSVHVITYFESFLFHRDDVNRPISTMSGGERNRLQLALNLKQPGDLLIFDEPTNDLDLETLQILEEKLSKFQGSVIVISHDRAFLSSVTNKVWLITNKSIENFEGGYAQAESYLNAVLFESLLNDEAPQEEKVESEKKSQKAATIHKPSVKLTNKEKEIIKKYPGIIEKLEIELNHVEKKIEAFDFSAHDKDQQTKYSEINSVREELEEKILSMYMEIEEIEHKLKK